MVEGKEWTKVDQNDANTIALRTLLYKLEKVNGYSD